MDALLPLAIMAVVYIFLVKIVLPKLGVRG